MSRSNTFELTKTSQKIWCQPISAKKWTKKKQNWKFPRFPSFRFWPYTEIENSVNLEIFLILVNFKEGVLLEKDENFRGFRVFSFGLYTEIKNSENSEIFTTLVTPKESVLLEEVGNFRVFRVFDFGPFTEIENSEN